MSFSWFFGPSGPPFTSDRVNPKFIRWFFATMVCVCLVGSVLQLWEDWRLAPIPFAFGVVLFLLFRGSRRKLGVVTAGPDGIVVEQDGETVSVEWHELTKLSSVKFVSPPVFRLRYTRPPYVTYFVPTSGWTVSIGFWTWEGSEMATYIRETARSNGNPI